MAKMVYTVRVNGVAQACPTGEWTHESATTWAHKRGYGMPEGTEITIWRRRTDWTRKAEVRHRRYEVGADGIVRRTDR